MSSTSSRVRRRLRCQRVRSNPVRRTSNDPVRAAANISAIVVERHTVRPLSLGDLGRSPSPTAVALREAIHLLVLGLGTVPVVLTRRGLADPAGGTQSPAAHRASQAVHAAVSPASIRFGLSAPLIMVSDSNGWSAWGTSSAPIASRTSRASARTPVPPTRSAHERWVRHRLGIGDLIGEAFSINRGPRDLLRSTGRRDEDANRSMARSPTQTLNLTAAGVDLLLPQVPGATVASPDSNAAPLVVLVPRAGAGTGRTGARRSHRCRASGGRRGHGQRAVGR